MMRVPSELRGLGYGPAEEARLVQTRMGTDPNSPGKQRARLASAIAVVRLKATAASRFEYQARSYGLGPSQTEKAKTRLKVSKCRICYKPFC